MKPLVSVICVCYNHERFVLETLESVRAQTYSNIELIIVDDGSTDKSVEIIEEWIKKNPVTHFLNLKSNHGYCAAFNRAFALATGEFYIDLATDDVLLPEKIENQIVFFSTLDSSYCTTFTDAIYIDGQGNYLREHFKYLFKKKLIRHIPQGDVYQNILSTYFIPSPTMMTRTSVLKSLGGYDENLVYEDFDFWVKSSRQFKYAFLNEKTMKIRRNIKSMSTGWYKKSDPQLLSTYQVCLKAQKLNRDKQDWYAWAKRVKYELRQSVFSQNHAEAELFYKLLKSECKTDWQDEFTYKLDGLHLPLSVLRQWYHRLRYNSFT